MSFLYGAFAGVRSHLSSIGTGARNGERSRRHTISAVASSASPLEAGRRPAGALGAEKSNSDHAGRTIVQDSDSQARSTKRAHHKSVTFSSVDLITHLPKSPAVSAAGPHTQSPNSPEFSIQTRRNSTSVLQSEVSSRHVADGHRTPHYPSDKSRRRRYTVSGPPLSPQQGEEPPKGSWYDHSVTLRAGATQAMGFPLRAPAGKRSSSNSYGVLPSIDDGPFSQPYSADSPPYAVQCERPLLSPPQNSQGPSIDSARAHRVESYKPAQYFIYRFDQPPVVSSPTAHFSERVCPVSYSCNGVEFIILSLTSRLTPQHAQHSYPRPECLALLDTRTASLIPSHFIPSKCRVEGKEIFVISNAPNKKGLGMFAQTPLRSGEVILTEVPTLIIPSDAPSFIQHSGSALGTSTVQVDLYETAFGLLPDGVKKELLDLAWGGAHSDYRSDVNVYETLMRINPLAVSLPHPSAPGCSSIGGSNVTSSIHRGIFLKASRCNHSCGPNAQWTFDPLSLTLVLTCLRPINTGDEITIAYISPYLPFFSRRADLKNLFGFDCSCDWCFRILSQFQSRSSLIEESDSGRKFLISFWDSYPSFEVWSKHPSIYPENLLISAHKIALEMIEREGLEGLSSVQHSQPQQWHIYYDPIPVPDTIRHTDGIALCYGALADVAKFRQWVARALDTRSSQSAPAVVDGWGAFEDIRWIGENGKHLQQNGDDVRLGRVSFQTDNIRRSLENWITYPETFPAWGLRRSNCT